MNELVWRIEIALERELTASSTPLCQMLRKTLESLLSTFHGSLHSDHMLAYRSRWEHHP
jgi:hypothetical protein